MSEESSTNIQNLALKVRHHVWYIAFTIVIIFYTILYFLFFRNKISTGKYTMWCTIFSILVVIYLFYKNTPNPRKHYMLSVMYGDKPVKTNFKHRISKGEWIFTGSTVINVHGEKLIFIGGGKNQDDSLLKYDNGKFIDVIDKYIEINDNENPTHSAMSIDMDGDGKQDLLVGRTNGVFLYKQLSKGFSKKKIISMNDKIPMALAVSDYNKDGKPDIYVSHFTPSTKYKGTVFNDPTHSRKNTLLKNVGNLKFEDVTVETKSGGIHNTFTSAFVDLNNDDFPDIVLANDSGEIEILKNVNGEYFETIIPYDKKGNWMGLGVGDIDNDGDQDLFFTNLGDGYDTSSNMATGDIETGQKQEFLHVLLRNDGDFKFVNVAQEKGVNGSGFGWGAVMGDTDMNGEIDLLFSENFHVDPRNMFFPGVGHTYEQHDGQMKRVFKYNNPNLGQQTPLLVDLNNDDVKDVMWINYDGPSYAYINKSKGGYLNVKLPETNEYVNAKITIQNGDNKMYREMIQGGVGFGGDNETGLITFGLGDWQKVDKVTIKTIHGVERHVKNPKINSTLIMKQV